MRLIQRNSLQNLLLFAIHLNYCWCFKVAKRYYSNNPSFLYNNLQNNEDNSYPYKLLGEWIISYQKQDKNNLNSYIKIYPTKLHISTVKDLAGGIITLQKEFYGKYNLYTELENKKSKISIDLDKEIDIIKSVLGISLGSKLIKKLSCPKNSKNINKNLKNINNINPLIRIQEGHIPLEIEILSISNTIIILSITGDIYKYKFNNEEVLLMRLCQTKQNSSKPINIILISNLIGYVITHLYDNILLIIEKLVYIIEKLLIYNNI